MGFNASLKKTRDTSLPIPKRYVALLSAMEHGHRSFHETWTVLQGKFGVGIGDKVNSDTLFAIADFLAADRQQWLASQKDERDRVRIAKRKNKN